MLSSIEHPQLVVGRKDGRTGRQQSQTLKIGINYCLDLKITNVSEGRLSPG